MRKFKLIIASQLLLKSCLKQDLACLEDHFIEDFEKFVHKKPGTVRTQATTRSIFENPLPFDILDAALVAGQGCVVKADVAITHPANANNPLILRKGTI